MTISILNVKVNVISKKEVLEKIKTILLSDEVVQHQLITVNPEFIVAAQKDEEFKNIINKSWLSVADGYGIRLAAKYIQEIRNQKLEIRKNNKLFHCFIASLLKLFDGLKVAWWGMTRNEKKLDVIKEVITGTGLVAEICKIVSVIPAQAGIQKKIFLLGGFGNIPQLTAENLKKQFNPSASLRTGNLTIEHSVFEVNDIIEKINNFQPTVLFVALNHPRAQKWLAHNLSQMPSVKLAMGVGGAFDYLSGKIKRAPLGWRCSFEWLSRLIRQPRRFKRIYTAVIKFPWRVFKNNF